MRCKICGFEFLEIYTKLPFAVTSSGDIVETPVSLRRCERCQTIFKPRNERDLIQIREIYDRYILHDHATYREARVQFDQLGTGVTKSCVIANHLNSLLRKHEAVPKTLLDIGCHFGSFLREFHKLNPRVNLYGYDISDRFSEEILKIPATYLTDDLCSHEVRYDVVCISHVLEHTEDPHALLKYIQKKLLTQRGLLFLQINNLDKNLFLPVIYEQNYSFTESTIKRLLRRCGFSIAEVTTSLISKDISILCHVKPPEISQTSWNKKAEHQSSQREGDLFLSMLKNLAFMNRRKHFNIGILGTSYSGKWLARYLKRNHKVFLEEDENQLNVKNFNVPVMRPRKLTNIHFILLSLSVDSYKAKSRIAKITETECLLPPFGQSF